MSAPSQDTPTRAGLDPVGGLVRRIVQLAAIILVLLGVLSMVVSPRLAEHFVFFPGRIDPGPAPVLAGVAGEDVLLTPSDGPEIHGWWHHVGPEAPAVLILHGNAGTIAERAPLAEAYLRRGISTFLLDYRGYGRSQGNPSEEGVYLDAETALDFVATRTSSEHRVVVHGRSLGAAIGAQAVRDRNVAGLIVDSAFTTLDEIASAAYPFLPGFVFRRLRGHFDTRSAIRDVSAPILVIHGTEDRLVPTWMGRELYEAARAPRQWYPIEGAGHNDVLLVGGEAYFDRISSFVRESANAQSNPREN